MDNQQETKFLYKLDINKVGSSETTCETLIFLFLFFHNPCPCPLGYFNFCLPRFWASGFYSYLHANICFPRLWLARMKACPCFCAAGKRAKVHFVLICSLCLEAQAKRSSNKNKQKCKSQNKTKVHFVLIFSLCLEAPFAFHFANATEAKRSQKNKKCKSQNKNDSQKQRWDRMSTKVQWLQLIIIKQSSLNWRRIRKIYR